MAQCFFGIKNELSDRWMVRSMNFNQDRPEDVPKTIYRMTIEVNELNEWSKTIFLEIKADAQNFPEDWDLLGKHLIKNTDINLSLLIETDIKTAHTFVNDFSYDILLTIEKQCPTFHLKPAYLINTVDSVKISDQKLHIQGQAFIMTG